MEDLNENQQLVKPTAQNVNQVPIQSYNSQNSALTQGQPIQKKSHKKLIGCLLGCLLILLLTGIGGGLAFFSLGKMMFTGGKEADQKVKIYLEQISANNIGEAYEMTSAEFQKEIKKEKFTEMMASSAFEPKYKHFQGLKLTSVSINETNGYRVYQYSGEITYDDGDKGQVKATLVREDNQVKIKTIDISVDWERTKKFIK